MTPKDRKQIRKAMWDVYQMGIDAWVVKQGRVLTLNDDKKKEVKERADKLLKYLNNTTEAKLERWPQGLFP